MVLPVPLYPLQGETGLSRPQGTGAKKQSLSLESLVQGELVVRAAQLARRLLGREPRNIDVYST